MNDLRKETKRKKEKKNTIGGAHIDDVLTIM